jgi:hypothetical protein
MRDNLRLVLIAIGFLACAAPRVMAPDGKSGVTKTCSDPVDCLRAGQRCWGFEVKDSHTIVCNLETE